MSVADYGKLSIFMAVVSSTASFIGLNAVSAANRCFFDDNTELEKSKYNGVCLFIITLGFSVSVISLTAFKAKVEFYVGIQYHWILTALIIGFFQQIILLRLGQWQVRGSAKPYFILQFSLGLSILTLTLILLIYLGGTVEVVIYSRLIVFIVFSVLCLYLIYRDRVIRIFYFNRGYFLSIMRFSIPLLPHTIGLYCISFIDRFFVFSEYGAEHAGVYMVAVQFSLICTLVFDALNRALIPQLYSKLKDKTEKSLVIIVRVKLYITLGVILCLPVFFYLSPKLVLLFAGEGYLQSVYILNILVVGQIFGGLYLMFTNYLFYAKATSKLAMVTFLSFVIHFCY